MALIVVFPPGKEVDAQAYADWTNTAFLNISSNPNAIFTAGPRADKHGQWVVAYLGPKGNAGAGWPEPGGGPAMRADGVLATGVEWPEEPEEEEG